MSADRLVAGRRPQALTAAECAERLRRELEQYGVAADVHEGFGLALVSVWVDLVVWTDGRWFRWRSGRTSTSGRPVYAFAPASDVVTAARRVAHRYGQLRQQYPPPPWLAGGSS
ncbi:hypothetical protein [Thermobispora bispora]|uniref:hypothetical protein n=1 Tax=Thermobispora bispora TaxID=2006 RepID=UPI0011D21E99|nr:hypothetical protein [Thermobispora bispora]MBX6167886.1 hypothetical protein [Thermobispora bispora]